MPVEPRFVCRFPAEPPQELLPYGRWAETLERHFLGAVPEPEEGDDLGEAVEIHWYPDRTWSGRTYVPATCITSTDMEVYGYVSFRPGDAEGDASDFKAVADYTDDTAAQNPHWRMDLCDEVIGQWRGEDGNSAEMTLVWGRPLIKSGVIVTAELADLTVDQCVLINSRFSLIAPDGYRGDNVDVKLFDKRGGELAVESLYADDDEDEDEHDEDKDDGDKPAS